jgi:hypothetical protein
MIQVSASADGDGGHYISFGLKLDGRVVAETETNDNDNVDRSSVQVTLLFSVAYFASLEHMTHLFDVLTNSLWMTNEAKCTVALAARGRI